MQKFIERILAFWACFGVDYVVLRYFFHTGRLSATLAYVTVGIALAVYRIEHKLDA